MITFLWLLLSTCFFAFGEYLSKIWAMNPKWKTGILIPFVYALGSLGWLPAIARGKSLTIVGTMWNVLSMLMTIAVGILIFHEPLTWIKIVGIVFAGISIVLLSL